MDALPSGFRPATFASVPPAPGRGRGEPAPMLHLPTSGGTPPADDEAMLIAALAAGDERAAAKLYDRYAAMLMAGRIPRDPVTD